MDATSTMTNADAAPATTAAALDRLAAAVAAVRLVLATLRPDGMVDSPLVSSRLDLFDMHLSDLRGADAKGTVFEVPEADEPGPDLPAAPRMYALTEDQLNHIRAADWMRGYDAANAER